jgi:two-component system response regulator HydG
VLIEGATGTGKELVAGLLHRHSRRAGAFVAFNICALSDSMFEDALFGHAKGAYTGAASDSLGFLREAHGGTAFLDEISGLPLPQQAKLLRAIETGVVRPIGSPRDERADFRIVAATNERLDELVTAGRFRADLAHRLSGVVIRVPTLDERREDIPLLVRHFAKHALPEGARGTVAITSAALATLEEHSWSGNVRELKLAVEAAVVLGDGVVDADALDAVLSRRVRDGAPHELAAHSGRLMERQRLVDALAAASWNTEVVAERLGVHRATVYRRMRRYGVAAPASGGAEPAMSTTPNAARHIVIQ